MGGALATGFGFGFLVAAGVGPIWLLCLRTSVRFGFPSGFAIGAGAAVVDTLYAALGVAGAAGLLTIDPLRVTLGIVGALVLAVLALRTLWSAFRIRLGGEAIAEVASPRRAFATSLAATASNPMTTSRFALPIDHTSLPLWCDTNASPWAAITGGRSAAPAPTREPHGLG